MTSLNKVAIIVGYSLLFSIPSLSLVYLIHTGQKTSLLFPLFAFVIGIALFLASKWLGAGQSQFIPRKQDRIYIRLLAVGALICLISAIIFLINHWVNLWKLDKEAVIRFSSVISLGLAFIFTWQEWGNLKRWERVGYFLTLAGSPPALISSLFF
ncbi:hypothetical protein [Arsenicibacter rosenii]|nr:hypothetical protein [Arsenicibacter rosenii]